MCDNASVGKIIQLQPDNLGGTKYVVTRRDIGRDVIVNEHGQQMSPDDADDKDIRELLVEILSELRKINASLPLTSCTCGKAEECTSTTNQAILPVCNCGNHKRYESTGGWFCPVHGHQV